MASPARSQIRVSSAKSKKKTSREDALRRIAKILEDQMTDMGLSEEEKNVKTAGLVAFVSDVAASKLAPRSKRSARLHSADLRG